MHLSQPEAPHNGMGGSARLRAGSKTGSDTRRAQLRQERRRQLRGLLLLVVAVLVFSIVRAGVGRVFPVGWWRLW